MKPIFCLGGILLLVTQVNAETYSWVDGNGTYNYTEEYSAVPKKYRKKVKRRSDITQEVKSSLSPDIDTASKRTDKTGAKSAEVVTGDEKVLYGGKNRDAWRKELDVLEAELRRIDQRMDQLRKQINDTKGFSKVQYDLLKKDYDENLVAFDQKYKKYNELIEAARKAGINVETKK